MVAYTITIYFYQIIQDFIVYYTPTQLLNPNPFIIRSKKKLNCIDRCEFTNTTVIMGSPRYSLDKTHTY
jgi:hypothetical protein